MKIFSICTLSCEYLRKFLKKFETALRGYSGDWGKLIHEKNLKSKISRNCNFKRSVGWDYLSSFFQRLAKVKFFHRISDLAHLHLLMESKHTLCLTAQLGYCTQSHNGQSTPSQLDVTESGLCSINLFMALNKSHFLRLQTQERTYYHISVNEMKPKCKSSKT